MTVKIGVNNTESLYLLIDGVKYKEAEFDHSYEGCNATLVVGRHDDGIFIPGGDIGFQKIVSVSDDIRKRIVNIMFEEFIKS